MMLVSLLHNYVLIAALIAWSIAQTLKVPIEYMQTHRWNWALFIQAGGMPSSHSALIVAITHGIGLSVGFGTPLFALGFAISMIVIYDATGIRRQAGKQAELINAIINDLTSGHPLKQEQLREVLGHTPGEALGGILLGLIIAQLTWMLWA
jgi:acid phosphatase family membrane protein YuiD